jgi:predicted oxidoreductase
MQRDLLPNVNDVTAEHKLESSTVCAEISARVDTTENKHSKPSRGLRSPASGDNIRFARSLSRSQQIEPALKEFIDQVLLPMLVRDALQDMSADTPYPGGAAGSDGTRSSATEVKS